MTRNLSLLVCAVALALCAGCGPKHTIDADALQGVVGPILDRHDHYVTNDTSLEDAERSTFLRSSEIVRDMVETAINE